MLLNDKILEFEKLITELEDAELDIDKSVKKYAQALKLASQIKKSLTKVEDQIKVLKEEYGKITTQNLKLER